MNQVVYPRMIPLCLLNEIKKRNLPYIVQPIIKDGIKIRNPINHDNGGVLCLTDITQIQNSQYRCKECQQNFTLNVLYYDVSLEVILSEVWDNPQLCHIKCVKIFKDGSWQVMTEEYKYFIEIEQKNCPALVQINEQFQQLEDRLSSYINVESIYSSIYQDMNLIPQVKVIVNKIDLENLQIDGLNLFITRRTDDNYLKGFEIYYTAQNKRELVTIAILGQTLIRDQVRLAFFYEESRIFYTKTAIYLIGGEKQHGNKELGFQKVYVAYIKDFINDSPSWPESKFMSFSEISSLRNRRIGFQIAEYNEYLYVIGGYTKVNEFLVPALEIEKLNLQQKINNAPNEWQRETSIQQAQLDGLHDFHCCVRGDQLILSGGVIIKTTEGICTYRKGNQETNFYNLKTQSWEAPQQNIFDGDNCQPKLIPSLRNEEIFYALGGLGKHNDFIYEYVQKKEVYKYSVSTKSKKSLQQASTSIDKCTKNYDLYSKDYMTSIQQFLTKINKTGEIEFILICNNNFTYNQPPIMFGAKILVLTDDKLREIKIMEID